MPTDLIGWNQSLLRISVWWLKETTCRNEIYKAVKVLACCVLVFSLATLGSGSDAIQAAIVLLRTTKPLVDPHVSLALADPSKREHAAQLFASQVRALHLLAGHADASIIPILIPFLNYSVDLSPAYLRTPFDTAPPLDKATLSLEWPAFGVICATPGNGAALSTFVADSRNPLDLRIAAFHVLRYVDPEQFGKTSGIINRELTGNALVYARSIEEGKTSFEGIFPISMEN